MEITCTRCHQPIQDGSCFCPFCGLPQLVYTDENPNGPGQAEPWTNAVRDASTVNWPAAMRASLMLAVPAGLLCSLLSPVSILCLFWMGAAAAWTVLLYVRNQQPAWITLGAGARIGLVTGVFGGWTAACASGVSLFAMRYLLHRGQVLDNFWENIVGQQMTQQWTSVWLERADHFPGRPVALARAVRRPGLTTILMLVFGLLLFCRRRRNWRPHDLPPPQTYQLTAAALLHSLPRGSNPSYHPARDTWREYNDEQSSRKTRCARQEPPAVRL